MIEHTPEFTRSTETPDVKRAREQADKELASAYARLFLGSDLGRLVLADMQKRFGVLRPVFGLATSGVFDPIRAALNDGGRRVVLFILEQIEKGGPGHGLKL